MGAVQQYLEGQSEGSVESTARPFTISLERAREAARRHRLQSAEEAILKFVQAAEKGAHGLTLVSDNSYEFWGWRGGNLEQLRQRLAAPFEGTLDDAIGSLTVGLSSLHHTRDLSVDIFLGGQARGQRLKLGWSDKEGELGAIEPLERPANLRSDQSLLRVNITDKPLERRVVSALLEERCPWARVRFRNSDQEPQGDRHSLSALRQRSSSGIVPPEAQRHASLRGWFVLEAPTVGSGTTIRLLKNGVILEEINHPGLSGPIVTICADHLQTDLTGLQFLKTPVKDELLSKVLSVLAEEDFQILGLSSRRPREVDKPVPLLCLLFAASLIHIAQFFFNNWSMPEVVNALITFTLVPLVEFNAALRESRKLMPLPTKLRWTLRSLAVLLSLSFFLLQTDWGIALQPHWYEPRFVFFAWLPLIADGLLNPEPNRPFAPPSQ